MVVAEEEGLGLRGRGGGRIFPPFLGNPERERRVEDIPSLPGQSCLAPSLPSLSVHRGMNGPLFPRDQLTVPYLVHT